MATRVNTFWRLFIYDDCAHEQYIPRNHWNYERELIEGEVRTMILMCSLCHPSRIRSIQPAGAACRARRAVSSKAGRFYPRPPRSDQPYLRVPRHDWLHQDATLHISSLTRDTGDITRAATHSVGSPAVLNYAVRIAGLWENWVFEP